MRIAIPVVAILVAAAAFACQDNTAQPEVPASTQTTAPAVTVTNPSSSRLLTVLGEAITEDAFRREERDRIEEHGYVLVCVAGREVFEDLLAEQGAPTADEERALEILDEMCAEARE